jgi:hypothetical protein
MLRLLISKKTKGLKRHSQNMLWLLISEKMKGLKRHSQNMLQLLISEKTKGLKRHSQNMLRLHISEKTSLYSLSKMSSFLSALYCCRFFFFFYRLFKVNQVACELYTQKPYKDQVYTYTITNTENVMIA